MFHLKDNTDLLKNAPEKYWTRIFPSENELSVNGSVNDFLKYPVCIYENHTYNVTDIIKYFSHFLGGVHSGMPEDNKEKKFTEINGEFPFVEDMAATSLKCIIHVTIKAYEPLIKAIQEHTSTGGL